jgi:phosphatidate cytidylyltransferase
VLKQRIITALILLSIIVSGILYLPSTPLAVILALFIIAGMVEWLGMPGRTDLPGKLVISAGLVAIMVAFYYFETRQVMLTLLGISLAWWSLIGVSIILGIKGWVISASVKSKTGNILIGFLILVPAWLSAFHLHKDWDIGNSLLLLFFIIVWSADTGAYFTGRQFGAHKLAPAISPGKTWEGVLGGMIAVVVAALAGCYILDISGDKMVIFVIIAIITAIFSIFGDLYISICKRALNLKDTSQMLPGHGGLLDRIDSTLSALPVYTFGLLMVAV